MIPARRGAVIAPVTHGGSAAAPPGLLALTDPSAGGGAVAGLRGAGPFMDVTPPQITCDAPPDGWHAENITFGCGAADAGSGLADPADASFSLSTSVPAGTTDPAARTDARRVCDAAGNCVVAMVSGVRVDRAPPTVTCPGGDAAWHAANVVVSCTAVDDGSGLDAGSDASFDLQTDVRAGTEDPAAETSSHRVCDQVGNCATAGPLEGFRIDRLAPRLSLDQSPDGENGWFNDAPAEVDVSAHDAHLTVLDCNVDGAPTGDPGATAETIRVSSDGRHSVSCRAVDAAGNETVEHATVLLDTSAPSITFAGEKGQYAADEQVTVSCAATDDLSGIAATTCRNVDAPAWTFGAGDQQISASATNGAGTTREASVGFTVTVDWSSLSAVTRRLANDPAVADALVAHLDDGAREQALGHDAAAAGALHDYVAAVRDAPAAAISTDDAATLVGLAHALAP